ncbi:MAG: hypothetical protein ACXW6J_07900 [Candidatus Binatia bacterium]
MAQVSDSFNSFFIAAEETLLATRDAAIEQTRTTLEPQQRLLLAILEDAIYCFCVSSPVPGTRN